MAAKPLSEMTNEELWQLFPIVLTEPRNAQWAQSFQREKQAIQSAVGLSHIIAVHHIGSTAIQGILAKPTIDILLEITGDTDIHRLMKTMEEIGYGYNDRPDSPPPHLTFIKGYTPEGFKGQVFHVHIRYEGDWPELHFRDYMNAHPNLVEEYAQLKLELKKRFEQDRDEYTRQKGDFIQKVQKLIEQEKSADEGVTQPIPGK